MGKGIVDETYENYLGMIGSYGNRCANLSFAKVDLLIALGSRLDTRQTGAKIDGFVPNGKIIHVDIDDNELKCHRILNRILFNTDVSAFLTQVLQADMAFTTSLGWIEWLQQIKQKYSQEQEVALPPTAAGEMMLTSTVTVRLERSTFSICTAATVSWISGYFCPG